MLFIAIVVERLLVKKPVSVTVKPLVASEDDNSKVSSVISTLNTELSEMRSRILSAERTLEEEQRAHRATLKRLVAAECARDKFSEQNTVLTSQLLIVQTELVSLKQELALVNKQLLDSNSSQELLARKCELLQRNVDICSEQVVSLQSELDRCKESLLASQRDVESERSRFVHSTKF